MKILVTGGLGFIGSHFIKHILKKYPNYEIINLDIVSYCANFKNLEEIENNKNYTFIKGDISDKNIVEKITQEVNCIINFAAQTHVDNSIKNPKDYIKTNIEGVYVLLEAIKKYNIEKFIQISTDEVYGSIANGFFSENANLEPNNPYSASKASADLLIRSYQNTYKIPAIITRCANNYGENQYPEKLIPHFISQLLNNKKVPLYGNGLNKRDWIYVKDNVKALDLILHQGKIGEIYNISANCEKTNLEITKIILKELNKDENYIEYVEDRPGHDLRYGIDSSKLKKELNWTPDYNFNEQFIKTIHWYINNKDWLKN